jgi:hypothetical protein
MKPKMKRRKPVPKPEPKEPTYQEIINAKEGGKLALVDDAKLAYVQFSGEAEIVLRSADPEYTEAQVRALLLEGKASLDQPSSDWVGPVYLDGPRPQKLLAWYAVQNDAWEVEAVEE